MPGRTISPALRSTSAARCPVRRMRSMISGDFTRSSGWRDGTPDSAYGGRTMWAGTSRIGLTMPGAMRPSVVRWQRLYLRPLPHQQGSLACSGTGSASTGEVTGPGYASCRPAPPSAPPSARRRRPQSVTSARFRPRPAARPGPRRRSTPNRQQDAGKSPPFQRAITTSQGQPESPDERVTRWSVGAGLRRVEARGSDGRSVPGP